jgi:ribulose 1,5-bisphosphate carboxylase large subunit-like protein
MKPKKKYGAAMQFISGGIAPKKSRERILESRLLNLEKRIKELEERLTRTENAHQTWNGL